MKHNLNVKTKYYLMLKGGQKTIELRLFDEKRQQIQVGHTIKFQDASNNADSFAAEVIALHLAKNFAELCNIINPTQAGFNSKEELIKVLEEFYPIERQNNIGVLGIEIKIK